MKGDKIMKYKDWLSEWLSNYIHTSNKPRTYVRYENMMALHIIPALGNYELNEITPILLQKFITNLAIGGNKLKKQGLSASYIACIMSVVQNSLKTAYSLGLISECNLNNIKLPKIAQKQVECFTAIEQKKIESYILSSKRQRLKGIILCFYTGLRIGELLALTWQDIDFVNKTMIVQKSSHDGYVNGNIAL